MIRRVMIRTLPNVKERFARAVRLNTQHAEKWLYRSSTAGASESLPGQFGERPLDEAKAAAQADR
jgi:hypothetical protein